MQVRARTFFLTCVMIMGNLVPKLIEDFLVVAYCVVLSKLCYDQDVNVEEKPR